MKNLFYTLCIVLSVTTFSCSNNNEAATDNGPITLEFDNVVESESSTVVQFTYHVNSIKLKRDDGRVFEDTGSHLVDEANAESQEITLQNVPSGNYVEATFTIRDLVLDGTSHTPTEDKPFQYHVGGDENARTITLSFNDHVAPVRPQHEPEVHLLFDVNKFLNGSSENAADNIPGSLVVDHIHAN